ncbi:MAG: response regulator transcription factor [Acidobacteria bacterium]|nr:response regulator transcription factor [Acidobacteriota bacterium]MBI3426678.1 response regulator transcription factor [Acidobacteriota bacterium]
MRTLIVDDEASARARLTRLLAAHASAVEIIGEAADGLQALQQITALAPDLLFLDIEMPGLNGLQVLQALPASVTLPLVVFVTGYDQHALAAFAANALAYLLKPVEDERLALVVDRAQRLHASAPQRADEQRELSALIQTTPATTPLRHIVARKRDRFLLLAPTDIYFFRVADGIVRAHTVNETYWVNYQLNQLEDCLPADQFFRAHRSTLINLAHIKELRPDFKSSFSLAMKDAAQTELQVSERQAPLLRRRFPGL